MMNTQPIFGGGRLFPESSHPSEAATGKAGGFGKALDASMAGDRADSTGIPSASLPAAFNGNVMGPSALLLHQYSPPATRKEIVTAYSAQGGGKKDAAPDDGWRKYKDDQLLRNPGGDHYYLERKRVSDDPKERESFTDRVGKDVSDSFGNVKNFFGNLLMGSKIRYRDEKGDIQEGTQKGLIGSVVEFFKDLGSAFSFGLWRPDNEEAPRGFAERLSFFGAKLKEAVLGDLVEGIPRSVNHMAKNVVLAGWNLAQVIPDATVGNFEQGRKLTTTIFDNGQVMVEYLTDVIPTGDAWFRVHAASFTGLKAPVLYNLEMPEHVKDDVRWQYVRNTPFRKTIESIGALLADTAAIALAGQTGFSSNQSSDRHELLKDLIR